MTWGYVVAGPPMASVLVSQSRFSIQEIFSSELWVGTTVSRFPRNWKLHVRH